MPKDLEGPLNRLAKWKTKICIINPYTGEKRTLFPRDLKYPNELYKVAKDIGIDDPLKANIVVYSPAARKIKDVKAQVSGILHSLLGDVSKRDLQRISFTRSVDKWEQKINYKPSDKTIKQKIQDYLKDSGIHARIQERLHRKPDEILNIAVQIDPDRAAKYTDKYGNFDAAKFYKDYIASRNAAESKKKAFFDTIEAYYVKQSGLDETLRKIYGNKVDKILRFKQPISYSSERGKKIMEEKKARAELKDLEKTSSGSTLLKRLSNKYGSDPVKLVRILKERPDVVQSELISLVRSGELRQNEIEAISKRLDLPPPVREIPSAATEGKLRKEIRSKGAENIMKKIIGEDLLGYKSFYNKTPPEFLLYKLKKERPEEYKTLLEKIQKGDIETVREKLYQNISSMGKISVNEFATFKGSRPTKQELDRLQEAGIHIEKPMEVEEPQKGIVVGKTGRRTVAQKEYVLRPSKGGKLGSYGIEYKHGKPQLVWYPGTISKTAVTEWIKGKWKERKKKKQAELEKFKLSLAEKYGDVLTPEEINTIVDRSWFARKRLKKEAIRRKIDEAYRLKKMEQRQRKAAKYEISLMKTMREAQKRKKAVMSPWWNLWYRLSNRTKLLLSIIILGAILFLPVGMFHVAGWALAVGIVALFQFIIGIFIEIWNLVARGIMAVINMIGQAVAWLFNAIGGFFVGLFGGTFVPYQFTLVSASPILIGEGKGYTWGEWNLIPPSFLRLEHYMPTTFDKDPIIAKIIPPLSSFFHLLYDPIAARYTAWIKTAEWYYVGAVIGIPLLLAIVGIALFVWYLKKKWSEY